MAESVPIGAYIKDAAYNDVALYDGGETITNNVPGYLSDDLGGETRLMQVSEDFDAENIYTLNFKPINPLPTMGVVKLVYPATVNLPLRDGDASLKTYFEEVCSGVTTTSFNRPKDWGTDVVTEALKYCFLEPSDFDADGQPVDRDLTSRTIWLFNLFADSEEYTSEVSLEMTFRNPVVNFEEAHEEEDAQLAQNEKDSFWISTYTFDLRGDFGVFDEDSRTERAAKLENDFYPVLAQI